MIDINKARENLKRKEQERMQRCEQRRVEADRDARAIIDMITEKYRPRRIFQWGSLVHTNRFNERSDIDIAIEGITDAQTWFALVGDAMQLTRLPLDIVQIEKIEPEFAEAIINGGKLVHERN
jgi:predicted nucleotidyltransferase